MCGRVFGRVFKPSRKVVYGGSVMARKLIFGMTTGSQIVTQGRLLLLVEIRC